jgi:tetratricopeptide (TPR) repeat protein
MKGRIFAFIVMVAVACAGAQQGSSTGSTAGAPAPSASQSNSSTQNAGAKPAPSDAPRAATPDELKFPEDDPAQPAPPPSSANPSHLAGPRSDRVQVQDLPPSVGESSSKDAPVDLSAPDDDAKAHPQSSEAVSSAEANTLSSGGVTELRSWDPHKAAKNVEVGDFYFRRKNYRAAEARYREALRYKDNDAIATIRLAVCLEKLGILDDARAEYESYLKILPHGPQAGDAQKAIERLKQETAPN